MDKVMIFNDKHPEKLENQINDFISDKYEIINVSFTTIMGVYGFAYSVMVAYRDK